MPMKEAETTHPIYFAAAITHMHTHTLIHQAPNVSKASFPKEYQDSVITPLNQSSFIYPSSSCLHFIPGSTCPGLPALFQISSKVYQFFAQSQHSFLIMFAPHECLITPSDINPAKRYLKIKIDADRRCDDQGWQDTWRMLHDEVQQAKYHDTVR